MVPGSPSGGPRPLAAAAAGLALGLVVAPVGGAGALAPLLLLAGRLPRPWAGAGWAALAGLLLGLGGGHRPAPPPFLEAWNLPAPRLVEGVVRRVDPPGPRGRRLVLDVERAEGRPLSRRVGLRLDLGPEVGARPRPGDRVRVAARLDRLRDPRNPGAPQAARRWARHDVHLRGWADHPRSLRILERGAGPARWIAAARDASAAVLDARLAPHDAGLLRALVLGDRTALTAADRERFRATGQAHLVAVSGLHVGLVLAGLLLLLRRLGAGRRPAAAIAGLGVLLYVPFVGAPPSAVRAGVGACLYLAGILLGRRPSVGVLLGAVALGVLAARPRGIRDPALLLSFTAVVGILLLAPRLFAAWTPRRFDVRRGLYRARAPARRALAVAVAAWLATAPLVIALTGRLCLLAAPLSLLAIPIAWLLLASGLLLLPAASLPGAGPALAGLCSAGAAALRGLLDLARDLGLDAVSASEPSIAWHAAFLAAWAIAACGRLRVGLAALLLLLLAALHPPDAAPPAHPRLVVLEVGHGQAVVLLLPDGRAALLDAGRQGDPGVGRRTVAPALRALGVRRLALVVATHADEDHVAGLPDACAAVPARVLAVPEGFSRRWLARLRPVARRTRLVARGDVLLAGRWGALRVLGPDRPLPAPRTPNDRSLVLRLETPHGSALLPSDREAAGVEDLIASGADLRAEVLLLPHHGQPGPGREALLRAARPAVRLASSAPARAAALPPATLDTSSRGALLVGLAPGGPVVRAPWSGTARQYDPRAAMPALATPPGLTDLGIAAAALALFAVASVRPLGFLTARGAAGAWTLGVVAFAAFGSAGLAALLAPFVVASLLSRLPGWRREGPRCILQVAANGLPALAGAGAALLGAPRAGLALFLGGLASLGADTCATEVGTRYGGTPRHVLTGRPVAVGRSGGVTGAGLLASAGGAFLAPLAFHLLESLGGEALGLLALAGVAGALIDSVLGATLQYRGRDPVSGEVTERRRVAGRPTLPVSGLRGLDNDGVNLVSGLAASLLALALLAWCAAGS